MLNIEKMLFPTDFSDTSEVACAHALHLARRYDAALHILHVSTSSASASPGSAPMERYDALAGQAKDVPITQAQVEERSAWQGILQYARRQATDLVVMGTRGHDGILDFAGRHQTGLTVIATHGRTGLEHFTMGSVAEKVVRLGPYPVFSLPAFGKSLVDRPASVPPAA